jgi:CubicO group peptidase (beta-lactamase class C family)
MANHFLLRVFVAICVAGCVANYGGAQSALTASPVKRLDGSAISPAEIDATVTRLMHAAKVAGVGIALFNDRKISYLKAYGFRDKDRNLPLTPNSIMIAASLSKSIFAFMVMQLVEEHVLDLDKPVYQYFPKPLPEYPDYTDLASDPRYKAITLRMLLSHTSGFPNWRAFTEGKLEIHFEPGSRFAYSGEGISLAQFVVETVTGEPLNQLMHEHVFDPLGMHNTNMFWEKRFDDNFANGYDETERSLGPQKRRRADAAGSMLTTLNDYALFLQALAQGKGLDKETRELMLSPQIAIFSKHEFPTLATETADENKPIRLSYGLGWGLYTTPYGPAFFKEGHDDGWRHYAVYFDKAGTGMLIMTNSSNGEGIYKELLETLLRNTYTPIEWESFTPYTELSPQPAPVEHHEVRVGPAALRAFVGRYQAQGHETLVVSLDGQHLFIQENDSPKMELFPEGQDRFFAKALDLTVEFQVGVQHRADGIMVHVKGMDIPAKRVD